MYRKGMNFAAESVAYQEQKHAFNQVAMAVQIGKLDSELVKRFEDASERFREVCDER